MYELTHHNITRITTVCIYDLSQSATAYRTRDTRVYSIMDTALRSNCKGRHLRSTRYISLNGYFSFLSLPNRVVKGIKFWLFDRTYCTYIHDTHTWYILYISLYMYVMCTYLMRTQSYNSILGTYDTWGHS